MIRISDYEIMGEISKDQSSNTVKIKEGDEAGEEWKLLAQDHSVTESESRSDPHTLSIFWMSRHVENTESQHRNSSMQALTLGI